MISANLYFWIGSRRLSPDHVHGGGSGLEEVGGVLDGRDVAQDALPDVLLSKKGDEHKFQKTKNTNTSVLKVRCLKS